MQNKTALVVDDSRVARMTLGKLLKAQDFDVVELESGEAALDWLQSTADKPVIVFMDVTMGGMDGLKTCYEIKSKPDLASIPVVICTGNDSETGLEKALSSGAVAVLSKPPAADALQALLDDVTATMQTDEPSATAMDSEGHRSEFDINAMTAALREQLMPELQQQLEKMTTDISRDIAAKTAQETSQKHGLSLIPEMTRQVSESAQTQLTEIKQNLASQANDAVSKAAEQAVDQALQSYGLTEKVMVTLRSEGMDWLNQQQEPVRETLFKQVQQDLMPMVSRCVDEQLNERVLPIVKTQSVEAQQESDSKQQAQLAELQAGLKQQRYISIGAAALAVIAIVIGIF